MTNEEKQAISRLTNIAQEKNSNWLGLSNIKAIETVLKLVEKQKILEHNYQVAIAETINKYVIKEKIEELKNKIKLNKQELDKNPDPVNSKFYSFDDYFKWKNKKLKENELIKHSIQVLKELLGEE